MAKLLAGSTVDGGLIWHDNGTADRESALIYQTTVQGVATGVWVKVALQTVMFDNLSGWNPTTQMYVCQKGGIYSVIGAVNWHNNGTNGLAGVRTVMEIKKNGTSLMWITQEHSGSAKDFSTIGNGTLQANAGDTLELMIYHDRATQMDTSLIVNGQGGTSASTFFNINKLA